MKKNLWYAIGLLVVGLFFLKAKYNNSSSKSIDSPDRPAEATSAENMSSAGPSSTPMQRSNTGEVAEGVGVSSAEDKKIDFSGESYEKERFLDSQKKMEETLKNTGLEIKIPTAMIYDSSEGPVEDSVALHGRGLDGQSALTMIAAKTVPPDSEILNFIKDSPQAFSNIDKKVVKWEEQSQKIEFKKESGIKEGSMWRGVDEQGTIFVAVILHREDQQGGYLFVQSGTKEFMDENDGYWDLIHDSLKALPLGN